MTDHHPADLIPRAQAAIADALQKLGHPDPKARLAPAPDKAPGDYGLPCFPYAKTLKRPPQLIAKQLAELLGHGPWTPIPAGPYLNLRFELSVLAHAAIAPILQDPQACFTTDEAEGENLLIEFSSPNTNKPQHLGHARNNVLGQSITRLAESLGARVTRVNLINDRGIAICKSMLAYQRFAPGQKPEDAGLKGDHFVGRLYVAFEQAFKEEWAAQLDAGGELEADDFFNHGSELGAAARALLQAWEDGDPDTRALWQQLNSYVFKGFEQTYRRLDLDFDWVQKESQTYQHGKVLVLEGLAAGLFHQEPDGAVACDLTDSGIKGAPDKKVLLRSDGTSLYITQDLGTAARRLDSKAPDRMVYVVADEQDTYFKILFHILDKLRPGAAERCQHLSYGMVHLPGGIMKSLEGRVVFLDDFLDQLAALARDELHIRERSQSLDPAELERRAELIARAALRYKLLAHNASSAMTFDPEAAVDFKGDTGPYLLYAYARSCQLLKKASQEPADLDPKILAEGLNSEQERKLCQALLQLRLDIPKAARSLEPSLLCARLHSLAQAFSSYYNAVKPGTRTPSFPILDAPEPQGRARLALVAAISHALKAGLALLNIEILEEM